MARILITGMSGAGKTTVLNELARRGYRTVDTDYDAWVLPDGTWDEPRMSALSRLIRLSLSPAPRRIKAASMIALPLLFS